MGATKKPRKKYRGPRMIGNINPLYVLESHQKLASDENRTYVDKWAIHNRLAFSEVLKGTGTIKDVSVLIACFHVVFSFYEGGIGRDYVEHIQAADKALAALRDRHHTKGTSALNYEERGAINDLLELFEQMLEIATVATFEQARVHAENRIRKIQERENSSQNKT